jgi:hypothetical protein
VTWLRKRFLAKHAARDPVVPAHAARLAGSSQPCNFCLFAVLCFFATLSLRHERRKRSTISRNTLRRSAIIVRGLARVGIFEGRACAHSGGFYHLGIAAMGQDVPAEYLQEMFQPSECQSRLCVVLRA